MMHGHEKSDPAIVAGKPANKAEQLAAEQSATEPTVAESAEPRAGTEGNAQLSPRGIPGSDTIHLRVMCSSTPAGRQCLA